MQKSQPNKVDTEILMSRQARTQASRSPLPLWEGTLLGVLLGLTGTADASWQAGLQRVQLRSVAAWLCSWIWPAQQNAAAPLLGSGPAAAFDAA